MAQYYIGVTSSLIKRVYEHKNHLRKGFAKKYKCTLLVYYALCDTMNGAINKEKTLKGYKRSKKIELIEGMNPEWMDLYDYICH